MSNFWVKQKQKQNKTKQKKNLPFLQRKLCDIYFSKQRKLCDVSETHCMMMTASSALGVGGRLKKEEICVYIQLTHVVVQQKLTQCCKAIILQWKKIQ